jgi:hypothetical protein
MGRTPFGRTSVKLCSTTAASTELDPARMMDVGQMVGVTLWCAMVDEDGHYSFAPCSYDAAARKSIMSAIAYLGPLHIHHRNHAPPFLRTSLRAPRALIAFMLAQP